MYSMFKRISSLLLALCMLLGTELLYAQEIIEEDSSSDILMQENETEVQIQLETADLTLVESDKYTLGAVLITDLEGVTLSWYSEDLTVAEIDENGEITAVSEGMTVIHADAIYEGEVIQQASCQVVVNAADFSVEIVSVISEAYNAIKIEWTEAYNASGYYVYRKEDKREVLVGETDELLLVDRSEEFKPGKKYVYTVEPFWIDEDGEETVGERSSAVSYQYQLAAPVITKVKVLSYQNAKIQWKPVKGTDGYRIYKKLPGGSWKRVVTLDGEDVTSYTDSNVDPGKDCMYTVRTLRYIDGQEYLGLYDKKGMGFPATWGTVKLVSAASASYNSVKITWKPLKNASGYRIFQKNDSGQWKHIKTIRDQSASSWTKTGLTTGKTYVYTVRAFQTVKNKEILSGYDNAGVSAAPKPSNPVLKSATTNGQKIVVKWTAVKGASGYRVYRRESGSKNWINCKTLKTISGGSVTSYTDKTVEYGKTYIYTVRAYRKTGNSTVWSLYDKKGVSCLAKPVAPVLKSLTPVSKTKLELTWEKVEGAEGYWIFRKNEAGVWKHVKTITSGGTTQWTDTSRTYGKTYSYTIKAFWLDGTKKLDGLYDKKGITAKLAYKSKYVNGLKLYYDASGNLIKDVDQIIGKQSSYVIKVNKKCNVVTVYAKDGKNGYIIPVKAFITSAGEPTPVGTYYTPAKYRWHTLIGSVYGQWNTRIYGGILFHSVYYYEYGDNTTLSVSRYNILGQTDSLGCCRLTCEDAKWIYDRCSLGTKVIVYNSSNPGPFGKPTAYKLESWHTWDPTDPNAKYLCEKNNCH